jgi:hypothetical protein
MVGPGMFDGALIGMIAVGVALGVAFCGIVYVIVWLCHHITIGWTP